MSIKYSYIYRDCQNLVPNQSFLYITLIHILLQSYYVSTINVKNKIYLTFNIAYLGIVFFVNFKFKYIYISNKILIFA